MVLNDLRPLLFFFIVLICFKRIQSTLEDREQLMEKSYALVQSIEELKNNKGRCCAYGTSMSIGLFSRIQRSSRVSRIVNASEKFNSFANTEEENYFLYTQVEKSIRIFIQNRLQRIESRNKFSKILLLRRNRFLKLKNSFEVSFDAAPM